MQIRIIGARDVKKAISMERAISVIATAFGQYSSGKAEVPLRTRLESDRGTTLVMPALLHETGDMAVKVVSVYEQNQQKGLPTIHALVMVIDSATGAPLALINGESLTALRTGAAGGLAADLLSRPDSRTVAIFGAGVQAESQLEAVLRVRAVEKVLIVDPRRQAAENLARRARNWEKRLLIKILDNPEQAVGQADIIVTATTARNPLFDGRAVRPGTHITGIGSFTPDMQEIDPELVRRCLLVADSRPACEAEAGDIIAAGAKIDAEIGQIVNREHPGRTNPSQITFFKSVGIAAQDAAAAAAVLKASVAKNLGITIKL